MIKSIKQYELLGAVIAGAIIVLGLMAIPYVLLAIDAIVWGW